MSCRETLVESGTESALLWGIISMNVSHRGELSMVGLLIRDP